MDIKREEDGALIHPANDCLLAARARQDCQTCGTRSKGQSLLIQYHRHIQGRQKENNKKNCLTDEERSELTKALLELCGESEKQIQKIKSLFLHSDMLTSKVITTRSAVSCVLL